MKIVIDTNMVIAALIKDSKARAIIMSNKFEFFSPDFVLEEVYKYREYICKKAYLTKDEFELLMAFVFERIQILPLTEYEEYKEKAESIMKDDEKDAPYVACYFALRAEFIWTNDSDYRGKKDINVVDTETLLKLL